MRGIRSTKRTGSPLLASGIPVLTQAVWTPKKEQPEPSDREESWRLPKSRIEKSPRTEKDPSEGPLALRVVAAVGRFPSRQMTLVVVWGLVLVAILPFAFAAFGGKGSGKTATASPVRATGGPGSVGPAGPAAARTFAARPLNVKEIGAAVVAPERKDLALEVLEALGSEDFGSAEELATGRFLEELVEKIPFVRGLDLESICVVARGPGWVRLEGRYRPSKPWFEKQEEEQVLILDLVEEESCWKLEDLRVAPRRNP